MYVKVVTTGNALARQRWYSLVPAQRPRTTRRIAGTYYPPIYLFLTMATEPENHHENAETRRQERREEANAEYREQGDDMRQGGPDPDLAHRLRTRSGDGNFDPNVQADDQTSDGVAAHIGSSGQGASQRGHDTEQNSNKAPDRLDQHNVEGGDLKD